jgi:hypothetical protein
VLGEPALGVLGVLLGLGLVAQQILEELLGTFEDHAHHPSISAPRDREEPPTAVPQ